MRTKMKIGRKKLGETGRLACVRCGAESNLYMAWLEVKNRVVGFVVCCGGCWDETDGGKFELDIK